MAASRRCRSGSPRGGATFARASVELGPALSSAIADVERSVPGARVVRVDEQLMNLGDLAAHLDRTAETLPPELIAATNLELAARAKR